MKTGMKKLLFFLVLYILSVVVRIYPIFVTPIPYNVDALLDLRASQFIADHGNLNFPSNASYNNHHTPVTILFNALCGAISQMTGIPVMSFIPYIFPFITSLSVLGWYLAIKKFTGREEIGIFASLFFALGGTYVLQSSLVWKEAIGLTIMPFAIYTYKKRNALSLFLFFLLPLTHHYVSLITYLFLSYSVFFDYYRKYKEHRILERREYLWIFATPLLWGYMAMYYFLTQFNRLKELSPTGDLWLFISLFVLLSVLGIKTLNTIYKGTKIWHHLVIALPILIFYGTYFINPIFPDTMKFNATTLLFTLGFLPLLPLVIQGAYILLSSEYKERHSYLSILFAPLQMVLFFFLRGLDLISYVSLSRTFDFLDPAVSTALGTSVAGRKRKVAAAISVFLLVATTTPLAYHTTEAFGVTYFIYPEEEHAAQWIRDNFPNSTVYTDDKLGLVARNGFDLNVSRGLPLLLEYGKKRGNIWLIGDYWKKGAQMSPMAPVKVDVDEVLENNSVVFSSGTTYVVLNGSVDSVSWRLQDI